MADESVHELSAAYALDALDARERAEFEAHLAGCEACRVELAGFSETATALAYAPAATPPPAALRGRIVAAATAERSNVVPLRRRRPFQVLAAAAAVAAAAAIGMGVWAGSMHDQLRGQRSRSAERAAVLQIAVQPGTRRMPLVGHRGALLVAPDGRAALVVADLPEAASGRTYEAWVISSGKPRPAGTFHGGSDSAMALMPPVPRGAAVAVTIERDGGADAPHSAPILQAQA